MALINIKAFIVDVLEQPLNDLAAQDRLFDLYKKVVRAGRDRLPFRSMVK